jgi:cytochrome c oxidase subunit II
VRRRLVGRSSVSGGLIGRNLVGRGVVGRGLFLAAWLGVGVLVAGCLPAPATSQARQIVWLYQLFVVIAAGVLVLVWGLLTWSVLRYRAGRRPGARPDELPTQTHGNTFVEVAWTAIPIATIALLFAVTVVVLGSIQARSSQPAVEIRVDGFRWGWSFSYAREGVVVTGSGVPGPEVVVPAGAPLLFTVSATDVVHSFYVPSFLAKYDAIPGRDQQFEVTIEQPGSYGGQCAEFCGILHYQMPFTVRAVTPAEYTTWVHAQPRSGS